MDLVFSATIQQLMVLLAIILAPLPAGPGPAEVFTAGNTEVGTTNYVYAGLVPVKSASVSQQTFRAPLLCRGKVWFLGIQVPQRLYRFSADLDLEASFDILEEGEQILSPSLGPPIGDSIVDSANAALYFMTLKAGARFLVKVDLETGIRAGQLPISELLPSGQLTAAAIDSENNVGYFGITGVQSSIAKVDLESLELIDALLYDHETWTGMSLSPGDGTLLASYFANSSSSGPADYGIHQISLEPLSVSDNLLVPENPLYFAPASDPGSWWVLINANQSFPKSRILKISHSPLEIAQTITLPGYSYGLINDSLTGNLYTAFGDSFYRIDWQNDLIEYSERPGNTFDPHLALAVVDSESRTMYSSKSGDGYLYRFDYSYTPQTTVINIPIDASIKSMHFYSHAADGNLRFAIYRSDAHLQRPSEVLWQSGIVPNIVAEGEVEIPVRNSGGGTLILQPGTYYLVWQSDSDSRVGSYVPSDAFNFQFSHDFTDPFESFPLSQWPYLPIPASWTHYVTYEAAPVWDVTGWQAR